MSKTNSSEQLAIADWRRTTLAKRKTASNPTETSEQKAKRLARWQNEDRAIARKQREVYQ